MTETKSQAPKVKVKKQTNKKKITKAMHPTFNVHLSINVQPKGILGNVGNDNLAQMWMKRIEN